MSKTISDASLIPVTLPAAMILLERHPGRCLYRFAEHWSKRWRIFPQYLPTPAHSLWSKEDHEQIEEWLGSGFRAFMNQIERMQFEDPVVDAIDGKLVIRSGQGKITPLD